MFNAIWFGLTLPIRIIWWILQFGLGTMAFLFAFFVIIAILGAVFA